MKRRSGYASSCGSSWECATLNVTPKAPEGGCACWNDFPKASNAYFTTGGWSCTSDGSGGWTLNSSTTLTLTPGSGNVLTFIDQLTDTNDPNTSPDQSLTGTNDMTGYIVVEA